MTTSGSAEWDGYRLMRDTVSSCRLNVQHYLWKQICGFNLDPRIPISAHESVKIADVGTGTGIWLLDVKPGTAFHIDGFDLSLEQCPLGPLLPSDCSIRKLDIQGSLPKDLKNQYDIVHVRLIQGGLKEDPVPALKNLMAMLKPGGYLQWQEINLSGMKIASVQPGLPQSNMEQVLQIASKFFGTWTPRLAEICTENGLLEAKTTAYPIPKELAIPFCQTQMAVYTEISWVAMDNSSPDAKGPKFRELLERATAEMKKGVWLDNRIEVTVARKAEEGV